MSTTIPSKSTPTGHDTRASLGLSPIWQGKGRNNECICCGRVMRDGAGGHGQKGMAHMGDSQMRPTGSYCYMLLIKAGDAGLKQVDPIGPLGNIYAVGYGPGPNGRECNSAERSEREARQAVR